MIGLEIIQKIRETMHAHMAKYGDNPKEITMTQKTYEVLLTEASSMVMLYGKKNADGVIVPDSEKIFGMDITVMDDGSSFFVVGGTLRKL